METINQISSDESLDRTSGPRGTQLPIIASSLVENIYTISGDGKWDALEKALDELKECGFNGFFAGIGVIAVEKGILSGILERAAERDMFVIISSDAFSAPSEGILKDWAGNETDSEALIVAYKTGYDARIEKFLEECQKSPGFGGVLLADEPTKVMLEDKFPKNDEPALGNFDTPKGSYYCLRNRYNIIKSMLNDNEVLVVNLVGDQNEDGHVTKDYTSYLDAFENISDTSTKPDLWSFDYYPITEHNYLLETNYKLYSKDASHTVSLSQNGDVVVGHKIFYDDLKLFQERARQCNGVYWSYVRSMEFSKKYEYYPVAIEPYLRFAIFSSLAMGCKGILYWTYHQRDSNEHELFLSAPLDNQGMKTAAWYYAKKLNEEIRRFSFVFRNSTLSGYGHIGKLYDTGQNLKFPFGRLTGIRVFGDGYLVTRLSNGTSLEYIVIVNHSVTDYQEITSFFSSGNAIYELTPYGKLNGTPQQVTASSLGVHRMLLPGGYLIYQYTK